MQQTKDSSKIRETEGKGTVKTLIKVYDGTTKSHKEAKKGQQKDILIIGLACITFALVILFFFFFLCFLFAETVSGLPKRFLTKRMNPCSLRKYSL